MEYLEIPNWGEYQHYKDRNPPWIKLHTQLLENFEFTTMPETARAHLVAIWLLASRTNNRIPLNAHWISAQIHACAPLDLDLLIERGFLAVIPENKGVEPACAVLADDKQSACPETEGETEADIYSADAHFDEFWSAYPRKVDKKRAKSRWDRMKVSEREAAVADVRRRNLAGEFWGKEKLEFVKHPSSYLNGENWNDEPGPILRVAGSDLGDSL